MASKYFKMTLIDNRVFIIENSREYTLQDFVDHLGMFHSFVKLDKIQYNIMNAILKVEDIDTNRVAMESIKDTDLWK